MAAAYYFKKFHCLQEASSEGGLVCETAVKNVTFLKNCGKIHVTYMYYFLHF